MLETNGDIYFEVLAALQWKSASYWRLNQICYLFHQYFFLIIVGYNNLLSLFGIIVFSYILFCYCSKRYRSSHLAPDQQLIITLVCGVLISSVVALITGRVFVSTDKYVHFHANTGDNDNQSTAKFNQTDHDAWPNFVLALNGNVRIFYCDSMYYFLLLLLAIYRDSFNRSSNYCYTLFSEWKSLKYLAIFILGGVITIAITMLFQFMQMGNKIR